MFEYVMKIYRDFWAVDAVAQAGFLLTVSTLIFPPIFFILFRRLHTRALIKELNKRIGTLALERDEALRVAAEDRAKIDDWKPAQWLLRAEKERDRGNEEVAIYGLETCFDRFSGDLAQVALALAGHRLSLTVGHDPVRALAEASRYARVATLLDPLDRDAAALFEETELVRADGAEVIAVLPASYLPRDQEEAAEVVAALMGLIRTHEDTGRVRIALRLCQRASLVARRAGLPRHAIGYMIEFRLAQLLRLCGKHEEALADIDALIQLQSGDLGEDAPEILPTRYLKAQVLLALGRLDESRAVLARVSGARSLLLGDDPRALLSATYLDAQILYAQGEHKAAYDLLHPRLGEYVEKLGARDKGTLAARYLNAQLLAKLGHGDQALDEVIALLALESETLDQGHNHVTAAKHLQASLLFGQERYSEALTVLRSMLPQAARNRGGTHPEIAYGRLLESRICLKLGRPEEALAILEELISALLQPNARGSGALDPNNARTFEQGRPDCAAQLDSIIQDLSSAREPHDAALVRARTLRARVGDPPKPGGAQRSPTGT